MTRTSRRSGGWRLVSVSVLAVIAGVAVFSPAGAHHRPGHTSKGSIRGIKHRVEALEARVSDLGQLQYVASATVSVPSGTKGQAEAVCPTGFSVTGGGGFASTTDWKQLDSYPSNGTGFPSGIAPHGTTAWAYEGQDLAAGGDTSPTVIRAYAVCSKSGTTSGNYTPGTSPAS
jgi:hypothetical protein